jgi:tRNA1(Val) A37 N6-methylase TrmN6
VSETTDGTLLGGRIKYRQFAKGHRSGFEPVLLAAAVPARPGQRVLEAGSGAGAALLCLGFRVPGVLGVGAEIDPALIGLAEQNFKDNGLDGFIFVRGDAARLGFGADFDHVMANPPWHDAAGTNSPDRQRALAHHAGQDALAAWIAGMSRYLRPRGTMTLVLPAASFAEAAGLMKASGCGAVSLFPLWPRARQTAKMVIISAVRGGAGQDRVLAGLVLHDEAGIAPAADAVLRGGESLPTT